MSNYLMPIYLTWAEVEELLGVVAAHCSDEFGRERPGTGLQSVMEELDRLMEEG